MRLVRVHGCAVAAAVAVAVGAWPSAAGAQEPPAGRSGHGWTVLPGMWLNTDQGLGMPSLAVFHWAMVIRPLWSK